MTIFFFPINSTSQHYNWVSASLHDPALLKGLENRISNSLAVTECGFSGKNFILQPANGSADEN